MITLLPTMAFGEESVEPAYAYIPNMGDASVSKVDLTAATPLVVARYFTAPRAGDTGPWGDLFGSNVDVMTAISPAGWRTSRLAIDPAGNAWALNTGADSGVATVQGSVARIQFDVSGLTTTSTSAGDIKTFGTDEAVTVFPIGDRGDCPRSINVTADGRIFIGFHKAYEKWGYFQEYAFNGTNLLEVGDRVYGAAMFEEGSDDPLPVFDIAPYNATIDVNGTLWFVSYGSSRVNRSSGTYGSTNGIYSFNIDDPFDTFTRHQLSESTYMPSGYGILVDDSDPEKVIVYATIMDTAAAGFYIKDGDYFVKVAVPGSAPRGLAFDDNGIIWIANSSGGSVTSYNPDGGATANYTGFGSTPVGIGKDPLGRMWVIVRDSNKLVGFDPATPNVRTEITTGFNEPYAYGDFAVHTPPTYEISGFKYRTGTEIGLGGWMIKLEKFESPSWVPVSVTATDINGAYSFTGLLAGEYRVSEVLKPGWTQTSPMGGVHLVELPYEGDPLSYDFENEPDMKCYDDTIWAYGGADGAYTDGPAAQVIENNKVPGNPSNNWGWTNQITESGTYIFTLYRGAGQNNLDNGTPVGMLTVDFDGEFAEIVYEVAEPYTLSEAHLWVGKTELPLISRTVRGVTTYTATAAPGQLANLGFNPEISADGLTASFTVAIDSPFWVAAHGVVDWCEMIPINETVYYHWGVGYTYGATPETYAVASVSPEGIMDVYFHWEGSPGLDAGWYHDIYTIVDTVGFTEFSVDALNEPVKLLHGIHFPGVDTTYYQRSAIDVNEVPVPNALSILIP